MNVQQILGIVLGINLAVVGVVDLFLQVTRGREATITSVVRATASGYPLLPFAIGLVMGHLLWCDCRSKEELEGQLSKPVNHTEEVMSSRKLP